MLSTSADACSTVRPGFRRAAAVNALLRRDVRCAGVSLGSPEFRGQRKVKAGGHHAGDDVVLVIQANGRVDDGRVRGKAAAPQAVAEDHFTLAAG